jgi:hypothetical protein
MYFISCMTQKFYVGLVKQELQKLTGFKIYIYIYTNKKLNLDTHKSKNKEELDIPWDSLERSTIVEQGQGREQKRKEFEVNREPWKLDHYFSRHTHHWSLQLVLLCWSLHYPTFIVNTSSQTSNNVQREQNHMGKTCQRSVSIPAYFCY